MAFERIRAHREAKQERRQEAQIDYDNRLERPLDSLLTDDKEILGESKELRHLIRDRSRFMVDSLVKRADNLEQKNNALDAAVKREKNYEARGLSASEIERAKEKREQQEKATKGRREKYLEYRDRRVNIKIARLNEKIENSPNTFLSRQINNIREQRLQGLQRKKKFIALDADKLETKRNNKPDELRKKVDKMIKEKVDAMYRKELRKQKWEKHGFNHAKRTEFVAGLTSDEKRKIVRDAILRARKHNIEAGRLDTNYSVDDTLATQRITQHYERTIK